MKHIAPNAEGVKWMLEKAAVQEAHARFAVSDGRMDDYMEHKKCSWAYRYVAEMATDEAAAQPQTPTDKLSHL